MNTKTIKSKLDKLSLEADDNELSGNMFVLIGPNNINKILSMIEKWITPKENQLFPAPTPDSVNNFYENLKDLGGKQSLYGKYIQVGVDYPDDTVDLSLINKNTKRQCVEVNSYGDIDIDTIYNYAFKNGLDYSFK